MTFEQVIILVFLDFVLASLLIAGSIFLISVVKHISVKNSFRLIDQLVDKQMDRTESIYKNAMKTLGLGGSDE